jgi:hypothetical protein
MRGIFWNSNGFKDPKKHKFVSDLIKENNLNFIAISEGVSFCLDFSKTCVQEGIIYGIPKLLEVSQLACC